jgi:hypothetical protein
MPDHAHVPIRIGQLNLRLPGDSAQAGHRVADGISERLARTVPPDISHRLGAVSLRVRVPAGATEAEMSDAISGAILHALRKGSRIRDARR